MTKAEFLRIALTAKPWKNLTWNRIEGCWYEYDLENTLIKASGIYYTKREPKIGRNYHFLCYLHNGVFHSETNAAKIWLFESEVIYEECYIKGYRTTEVLFKVFRHKLKMQLWHEALTS